MVDFILFLVHRIDASSGPELQQSLKQQSAQVYCGDKEEDDTNDPTRDDRRGKDLCGSFLHFGSDPSELEKPASFADTQAAKQSLSSSVMVSICSTTPLFKAPPFDLCFFIRLQRCPSIHKGIGNLKSSMTSSRSFSGLAQDGAKAELTST